MIDRLTIAFPYYESPEKLQEHLDHWKRLPSPYTQQLEVIIVDDGSRKYPAEDVLAACDGLDILIQLYRIEEDIPWNHGGAKNLAMHMAQEGWVALTYIDHVLTAGNIMDLIEQDLSPDTIYTLERYEMLSKTEREAIRPHIDTFVLTRKMFWVVGGYDEDFSGFWNGPCMPFRKALKKTAKKAKKAKLSGPTLHWYSNRVIQDANVVSYGRKGSVYDINKNFVENKKQQAALTRYKPKNPLRFTWKQIA